MLTRTRDLRTGLSVWTEYRQPRIPVSVLPDKSSTDILIIGAGISGAMLAEELSGRGLDVMIVDRRDKPVTGSTMASTALLQYEIDIPLSHLKKKIGVGKAVSAWRRSKLAVDSLGCKIRDLDIDCGYERRNSLYLSGNVLNEKALREEQSQRSAIGLYGRLIDKRELKREYGIRGECALLGWDNIACNPVQLAAGLFKAAIKRGAVIHTQARIDKVSASGKNQLAVTEDGKSIRARHVVFTTGYEIPDMIRTRRHTIQSSWALSTKPVGGMPDAYPFVWEAAEPYLYARTGPDRRMIFGGEDAAFDDEKKRDALIPEKTKLLERKMRATFPDFRFETEHSWAGSFGASTTGLPSIGTIPGRPGCYAVMAYGGNGITFSRIAAELISAEILGLDDPDKRLFAFPRRSS